MRAVGLGLPVDQKLWMSVLLGLEKLEGWSRNGIDTERMEEPHADGCHGPSHSGEFVVGTPGREKGNLNWRG